MMPTLLVVGPTEQYEGSAHLGRCAGESAALLGFGSETRTSRRGLKSAESRPNMWRRQKPGQSDSWERWEGAKQA